MVRFVVARDISKNKRLPSTELDSSVVVIFKKEKISDFEISLWSIKNVGLFHIVF